MSRVPISTHTRLMRGEIPAAYAVITTHMGKRVFARKELSCTISGALEQTARLMSCGPFERTSQPVTEGVLAAYQGRQVQHCSIRLNDSDGYLSKLMAKEPFLSRTLEVKVGFEAEAESNHPCLFSGTITEVSGSGILTVEAEVGKDGLFATHTLGRASRYLDIGGFWQERSPYKVADIAYNRMATAVDMALVAVCVYGGNVYTTPDKGMTWTTHQPAGSSVRYFWGIACDDDGSNILVGIYEATGRLWLYSSGAWAETRPAGDVNRYWVGVAMNSTGSIMFALAYGGRAYKYSGGAWAEMNPTGSAANYNYYDISCSRTALYGILAIYPGRLYITGDTGGSWIEKQPAGAVDKNWRVTKISKDGKYMLAAVYGGRAYINDNYGSDADWYEVQPDGDTDQNWIGGSCGEDGGRIFLLREGKVYMTTDGGTTWITCRPTGDTSKSWRDVVANTADDEFMACANTGRVYYSEPSTSTEALPIPYGDLSDAKAGAWRMPRIGASSYKYLYADCEVLSEANGNVVTVFADGVAVPPEYFTFDESEDVDGLGAVATVTFTTDRSGSTITAAGKGKASGATLIENVIDQIEDFLTVEGPFTSSIFNDSALSRAYQVFAAQAYKAAGVITEDCVYWNKVVEMMASFLGSTYIDGSGLLVLHIEDGVVPASGHAIIPWGDVEPVDAKLRLDNIINQLPAGYRYNFASGAFDAEDDGTTEADLASQGIYGLRKPATPYEFIWCRDLTSVRRVQGILVGMYRDPPYELEIWDKTVKQLGIDLGDIVAYSADRLYDRSASTLMNQLWRTISVRPDLDADSIRFRLVQTPYYLLSGSSRDTTKY